MDWIWWMSKGSWLCKFISCGGNSQLAHQKIQMPTKYAPKTEIAVLNRNPVCHTGTNTSVFYFNSLKIHPPSSRLWWRRWTTQTICYNGTFWIVQPPARLPTLIIERYKRTIVIIIIWSAVPYFSLSPLPSVELMPLHPLACLFVPTHNCSWWVPDWFVLCAESENICSQRTSREWGGDSADKTSSLIVKHISRSARYANSRREMNTSDRCSSVNEFQCHVLARKGVADHIQRGRREWSTNLPLQIPNHLWKHLGYVVETRRYTM